MASVNENVKVSVADEIYNEGKPTVDTIVRTVALALALVNQILLCFDISPIPIADETLELLITTGFTVVTALCAWWKNNSFTKAAILVDKVLAEMKKQKKGA